MIAPRLLPRPRILRRLGEDRRGATIVEFAFVAPVLMLLLMGTLEVGYQAYVTAMVQGALTKAARLATVGGTTKDVVIAKIKAEVRRVGVQEKYVTVSTTRYFNYSNVGKPEKITQDTAPLGTYNIGDCYEDANNNGVYDATPGDDGVGSADDVIYYTVKVDYPNLTPVLGMMKWGTTRSVSATMLMRNQPFSSRAQPTTRCS